MSRIWLYPISASSDYYFAVRGKRWKDGGPESFAAMVQNPTGTDDWWHIHSNRLKVHVGDQLVVYAARKGKRPPLIVGVGSIASEPRWFSRAGQHKIRIEWDLKRTLPLSIAPLDASYLMRNLQPTKGAVVSLRPDLEEWVTTQLELRRKQVLSVPPGVKTRREKAIVVGRTEYEAMLRHDPRVLDPFRWRLADHGWSLLPLADVRTSDLIAIEPNRRRVILVEAKTNTRNAGRAEIRYALGQLADYQYFIVPQIGAVRGLPIYPLILLEAQPSKELIPFVESLGVGIAWHARGKVAGGPNTKKSLGALLD